jgi:hypothetical protein
VTRIVGVKATYGLWVTKAEHDAITRILNNDCTAPTGAPVEAPEPVEPAPPPPADQEKPAP